MRDIAAAINRIGADTYSIGTAVSVRRCEFYSHYVSTAGINPGSATTAAFFDINVMLASRLQYQYQLRLRLFLTG